MTTDELTARVEKLEATVLRLVYLHSTYGFTSAFMREADALYHDLTGDATAADEPSEEPTPEPSTSPDEATEEEPTPETPEPTEEAETAAEEPSEDETTEPSETTEPTAAEAFAALSPEEQAAALQSVAVPATDTAT